MNKLKINKIKLQDLSMEDQHQIIGGQANGQNGGIVDGAPELLPITITVITVGTDVSIRTLNGGCDQPTQWYNCA